MNGISHRMNIIENEIVKRLNQLLFYGENSEDDSDILNCICSLVGLKTRIEININKMTKHRSECERKRRSQSEVKTIWKLKEPIMKYTIE